MGKKYIITILFLNAVVLNAQYKPSFGFKLGVNIPNVAVTSDKYTRVDVSSKYGIDAFIFAEISVMKRLSLVSELGYEQKYVSSEVTISSEYYPGDTVKLDQRSDYLSYILKAKYRFTDGGVKPYCALGISVNAFLQSKLYGTSSDISSTMSILAGEGFRRFNYSVLISAGCEFEASSAVNFLTEMNFSLPTDSYFVYKPGSVYARTYGLDFRIGLRF